MPIIKCVDPSHHWEFLFNGSLQIHFFFPTTHLRFNAPGLVFDGSAIFVASQLLEVWMNLRSAHCLQGYHSLFLHTVTAVTPIESFAEETF